MSGRICAICGASTKTRLALWRYGDAELGHEYGSGWRCVDESACKAEVESAHAAAPEMFPAWDIIDGPFAAKPQSPWAARADQHAPDPREVAAGPTAAPATGQAVLW